MESPLLKVVNVSKSFPGVKALDKVCLEVKKGEVHALLGENGAGKSTLIKILSGVYTPDEGEIYINGEKYNVSNAAFAEKNGIFTVYQELSTFPALTVAENIFANRLPRTKLGAINYKALYKETYKILNDLEMSYIKPKDLLRNLSISKQQIVEIARAISQDSKLLILDEPTSALTEHETAILFRVVKDLKSKGVSIIYISHRLEEIFGLCDTVSVFRDGKYITSSKISEITKEQLVKHMVGRDVAYEYGVGTSEIKDKIVEVRNLKYKDIVKGVDLTLNAGEILGIAGLEGSGRTELVECIFGWKKKTSGQLIIDGKEINEINPRLAKKYGLAYITKDRKQLGLFLRLSVNDNIASGSLKEFSKKGIVQYKKISDNSKNYVEKFDIKTPDIYRKVMFLSGGNQQKVLLSMWLTRSPKVIIVDEPTRGIDVGTKAEIHYLLRGLAKKGVAILMISSEMPELFGACDRIMVMYEGKVTGILNNEDANEEKIIKLASNQMI